MCPPQRPTPPRDEPGRVLTALCLPAKEEEKQKLMKWSSELKVEREQLEQRVKQLSNSITVGGSS